MTDIDTLTGEIVPHRSSTLFHTDDPTEVLPEVHRVAAALEGELRDGAMVQKIGRNEHVLIEGWQTLGSMLGVTAHTVWSRQIENGWEARAEARTLDGRVISAAEAMVTHEERNWRTSDEYALRSMAQTRAMSKALKGPLGFIMTMAGKSSTPAEEMAENVPAFGPAATNRDSQGLVRAIRALYGDPEADLEEIAARLEADAGGYLPKIVARAVMLVTAHRPDPSPQEAGTAPQDVGDKDATTTANETSETPSVDDDATGEGAQGPDA